MKMQLLKENVNGRVYRIGSIPNSMFNFYILKGRVFADGSAMYKICVEYALDTSKYMVLDTIRGTADMATARIEELVRQSRQAK